MVAVRKSPGSSPTPIPHQPIEATTIARITLTVTRGVAAGWVGQEVVEHAFPGYGGSRALYVDDPDGNVVELWTWDVAQHLTSGG